MNASDIMSDDVVTIDQSATLAEALELLSGLSFRHLPVVSETGEVVGILSDRDLREFRLPLTPDEASLERLRASLRASVTTAMSTDVVSVTPDTEVEAIIDCLVDERVGAVPVIDEHTKDLVGMVSYVDVLRSLRPSPEI